VRAIKVVVAPIIFTTIAVGIAKMGDIRHVANVGVKALIYFEVASTLALIVGMTVGNFWQVGVGLNADPAAFDPKAVEAYAKLAKNVTMSDFFLSMIPTSFVEPFVKGDIMPVLFIAVLLGLGLSLAQARASRWWRFWSRRRSRCSPWCGSSCSSRRSQRFAPWFSPWANMACGPCLILAS
jgi:Na+/H+-dicarboxylate symporter